MAGWLGGRVAGWPGGWAARAPPPPPPPPPHPPHPLPPTDRNMPYHCIMPWSPLSKTIAAGALQVNETNNFQHMLFKKNFSSSISCAMWGALWQYKHEAKQVLHQPARGSRIGGDPPPPPPPLWSVSLPSICACIAADSIRGPLQSMSMSYCTLSQAMSSLLINQMFDMLSKNMLSH